MQSIRTHLGNDFEFIRWITYVLLGGVVNASFAQVYVDFVYRIPQIFGGPLRTLQQQILFGWLPLSLIAFAPLFLSILLTRMKPEKQIVPPLFIVLVSLAWFAGFVVISYPSQIYPILVAYVFFAFFVATVENTIAVFLLGVSVRSEDFLSYSFTVNADKQKIRDIFEVERIRKTLAISEGYALEDRGAIEFEKGRDFEYQMRLQILQVPSQTESLVNCIFYDETDWYVKPINDKLKEHAESVIVYLKSLFQRPEHQYSINDKGWVRTVETDALISSTMSEMEGVIPRFREVSRLGWVKIAALLGAMGLIGYTAFWLQDYSISAVLFGSLLISLVFELRSEQRKSG